MTVFQIIEEKGYSRKLSDGIHSPTPWLLKTAEGLKFENVELHQIILSERGFLPLTAHNLQIISDRPSYDIIISEIPEWSILTPRLYPAADNLQESLDYELNLFLDRLDTVNLPNAFGLTFDLLHGTDKHLKELLEYNPSILVLRHTNIEDESPRKVLSRIMSIRQKVSENIALYLPGSGGIGYQSMLIALGIDIFDDLSAYRYAARHRGFIDNQIHYLPEESVSDLIDVNTKELYRDFDNIVFHLDRNTLWSKFDKDMHVSPHIASFRHLIAHDQNYNIDLNKFAKFTQNELKFIGEEGLYHPDVLAYQKRLEQRYNENPWIKVIVLLPCSARKPYRESYSHQRYEKAIQRGSQEKRSLVSVWSLTSPLGVVPRAIETVYPAQYYDIPVTGHWSYEESRRTGELLGHMLNQLPNDVHVIVHSSKDYESMITVAQKYHNIEISWLDNRSRSEEALNRLSDVVLKATQGCGPVDLGKKGSYIEARNTIQAITKYNHGPKVHLDFDYNRIRILGRPPRPIAIQRDKQHWITWDKLKGDVRLHQLSAMDIASSTENWILVTADKLRGSNLFNIGIGEASPKISPGDEVIFFNEDKTMVLGIGVSKISGLTMNRVTNGIAATIRKKFVEKLV